MKYLVTVDSLSTCHYLVEAVSLAAACSIVESKYPGGTWSTFGTEEYRRLEREYALDDSAGTLIFVQTPEGIKDSVIASAKHWPGE